MKNKKIKAMLATALIFSIVLPMGSASVVQAEEEEKILVMGSARDLKNGYGDEGAYLVFDTLLGFDESQSIIPKIIKSWDANDDASQYTLKIQEGVEFTDGTELNAEVVKYALEVYAPFASAGFVDYLKEIEVVDDLTLNVALTESYGNFPLELTSIFAVKKDSVDETGNITDWTGTGPFILDDYQVDQEAVLSTNENYWDTENTPKIDGVDFIVIPDADARIMALKSGEVDVLGVSECFSTYPQSEVAQIMEEGELNVDTNKDAGLVAAYSFNYKEGLMTDINLRKAVVYAIDRDMLAETVLYGLGNGSGDFLPRVYQYSAINEEPYTYDMDIVKESLAEGGYEDTDGDGIVEKDGEAVKLNFVIQSGATAEATAVLVQDFLRQAGIDSELTVLDSSVFAEQVSSGDFDICYTHPWMEPQSYMLWRGLDGEYDSFGLGYGVSDNFETYLHDMLVATDSEQLQEVFNKIWAEIYPFYPATPLYASPRIFMFKKNISGFVFNPNRSYIDLSNVVIE